MIQERPLSGTEEEIERHLQAQTFGRVRHLHVAFADDRLVVYGSTSSYYVVQLVVRAIREILPETPDRLEISDGSDEPSLDHSRYTRIKTRNIC
jgi:hypothetical protein